MLLFTSVPNGETRRNQGALSVVVRMGAPDAELQEWVNNSCHPLPGTDMKSPHHINENQARLDAASVFLKSLIGWLLDADGREGFSFSNTGHVLKELRPYYGMQRFTRP